LHSTQRRIVAVSEDKEPQPIWRQQSPIDLVLGTSLPTTFARDYLVIGYPNADLPGRFKSHNFYFDAPPPLTFNGQEASLERLQSTRPANTGSTAGPSTSRSTSSTRSRTRPATARRW
jgi:hypothetical protein